MFHKWTFLFLSMLMVIVCQAFGLNYYRSTETLNKIMEIISCQKKGVYLRFGDGDVLLAERENDSYQRSNAFLQNEMREALALNGPTILKSLPLSCRELGGYEEGMNFKVHERPYDFCMEIMRRASPWWNGKMEDVFSPTALAYCAVFNLSLCLKFLKFIKNANCILLVGNENIPLSIKELLFGTQCQFVPTPAKNSYDQIDWIEQECLEKVKNISEYKVIVTSMGCSGRVLQKRLWYKLDNVFLFDFGSLMDALCGWNTRDWIDETKVHENQQLLYLLKRELAF